MSAEQEQRARQALTFVAQTLRPDWDPPGIHAAIEALHRDRETLGAIARGTIAAALTPSTKTPGGIAARIRDGFDGSEAPARTPDNATGWRCSTCPAWVVRGEHHVCGQILDPDQTATAAAAARAAIKNPPEESQ